MRADVRMGQGLGRRSGRLRAGVAVLAAAGVFVLGAVPVIWAQTIGPGGVPLAPGASQPGYVPGGIGPGGVPVAPGPAARGVPMEEMGPGGVPIAPGPAGSIQQQRPASPPSVFPSTATGSVIADENGGARVSRHGRGGKHGRRRTLRSASRFGGIARHLHRRD